MIWVNKIALTVIHSLPAAFIFGALTYFAPMAEVFTVLLAFVVTDLISGIAASRKKLIPCNSRRLRQSVVKMISYITVMMLVFGAEKSFGIEWLASYKLLGGFICMIELLSILENLAILTEKPVFLKLIKIIRGRAAEKNGTMLDDILNEKND